MQDGQVFREVEWTFRGETLRCVPSIALLRRLRSATGIGTLELANQAINGGSDPLDVAAAHVVFAAAAGVVVTEDESYAHFTSGNQAEIVSFQFALATSILPGIDLGKKPDAPAAQPKPKKKPQRK